MTFVGFLILFVLSCLFPCEGKVILINETSVTLVPGSTGRIVWSFNDTIKVGSYRLWSFTPSNGIAEALASIIVNGDYMKLTNSYEVAVEKPATLVLKNVNMSYNGKYEFSLQPSSGVGKSEVVVHIAEKPTVTVCSSPIMVNEGGNVTCLCEGRDGNPPADVTWYKGDRTTGLTGKEKITLTLHNVSEKDGGSYKCVAQSYPSIMFKDEKIVEVKVKLNYKPNKPVIMLPPNNIASLGDMVTITCKTDGLPQPNYTIFHNGTAVSHDMPHIIPKVNLTHSGNYTCTAENKLGRNSTSAILFVKETQTTNTPTTKNFGTGKTALEEYNRSGTEWYIVVVSLVSGIIIGILFSYIVSCCRRKFRSRDPQSNSQPQPTEVDATYQELDLTRMNAEDNYQSLRVNAASNDVANDHDPTYTELNKTRDVENNYQSLT